MLNRYKNEKIIDSGYFDEISEIEVKHVDLDFGVDRLFSEYQMPSMKTKNKLTQPIKKRPLQKKTQESSISTKERSNNLEQSCNTEKNADNMTKQGNLNSLKKNISKKILFLSSESKQRQMQSTGKKTTRKKTIYFEFQRVGQTENKLLKSPETVMMKRKVSKSNQIEGKLKSGYENYKVVKKQKNPMKISRQSSSSNKNLNLIKKSRSQSIMTGSRQRLDSKQQRESKQQKLKQDNKRIIMRDYFGQDEEEIKKNKINPNTLDNVKNKRSSSKSSKDFQPLKQKVEPKSKEIIRNKLRERIGSKSKEKVLVFSTKNKFL